MLRFFTKKVSPPSHQTQSHILLNEEMVPYLLLRSPRAKRIRISIHKTTGVRVTIPLWLDIKKVEPLMREKGSWILSSLTHYRSLPSSRTKEDAHREYMAHKQQALKFVQKRTHELNTTYNFSYNKITIKNQSTLWGSCSRKGNLNFNYKIALLPKEQADYIIIHELCHLQEFNHSERFWQLVEKQVPDYKRIRRELRTTGLQSH